MDRRGPALQKGTSREGKTNMGVYIVGVSIDGVVLLPPFRGHKIKRPTRTLGSYPGFHQQKCAQQLEGGISSPSFALVRPHLEYCGHLWGLQGKNMEQLE